MILTYRALTSWPGDLTNPRRGAQFKMDWHDTLRMVGDEVDKLAFPPHGDRHAHATIQLATTSLRADRSGILADAQFDHPGVILTFDNHEGRELTFRCDTYTRLWGRRQPWRDNFHAIGLTLKALRDVSRYGAVDPGQQYQGFMAQLGSGIAVGVNAPTMTRDEAAAYLSEASEGYRDPAAIAASLPTAEEAFRFAAHLHHPDRGGNATIFAKVADAIAVLRTP